MASVLESLKTKRITGLSKQEPPTSGVQPESFACEKCGSHDFWLLIGSLSPRCGKCSRPPLDRMVAMRLVVDDRGQFWQVVTTEDGDESLVKLMADFTPSVPNL